MRKALTDGAPGASTVEETVTTRRTVAADGAPVPKPAREPKQDINEYYSKLDPAYRRAHTHCYLYRLDANIVVPETNEIGQKNTGYIWKFKDEEIEQFCHGAFLEELQGWVKNEYGGGMFQVKVNDSKIRAMTYNLFIKNEGPPRISTKETVLNPAAAMFDGSNVGMMLKYIDERTQRPAATNTDQILAAATAPFSQALQFALNNMPKPASPEESLERMLNLMKAMKDNQAPPPAPVVTEKPKSLMEQIQEFNAMMEMLEKMKGGPKAPEANLATQIVDAIKAAGIGAGRSRGADYLPALIDLGKSFLPALAPIGIALAEKIRSSPAPGQAPRISRTNLVQMPGQPGAPAAPAPSPFAPGGGAVPRVGSPGAAHGASIPPNGFTPPPAQPEPPNHAAPPGAQRDLTEEDVSDLTRHIISTRLLAMLTNDESGADAAAAIQDMFPQIALQMKFATVEMMQAEIERDPILMQAKNFPNLPKFLKDFYDFFHPDEGGEGEDIVN